MSSVTTISEREAVPVTVGDCTVYCESFRASAVRTINEETTVDGRNIITSMGLRGTRITFSGRIYNTSEPLGFLMDIGSSMSRDMPYTVDYRGLRFIGCFLQKYEMTDSGNDWIEASFTLLTLNSVTEVPQ